MKGKFILVVGPSGSGKDTLIAHIRPLFPELAYAKSTVTRAMRPGEENGKTYNFISRKAFESHIQGNDFLEWAEYSGNYYGTMKSEVLPLLEGGRFTLKEMEVQGARQIQEKIPADSRFIIFINAGSWDDMEKRILARAPMSPEELSKRNARYEDEMSFLKEVNVVVANKTGNLDQAKLDFEAAIRLALNPSED